MLKKQTSNICQQVASLGRATLVMEEVKDQGKYGHTINEIRL